MKIAMISEKFNKMQGAERSTVELSERFVKLHEVHLITRCYDYHIPGLHVHSSRIINKPRFLQAGLNAVENARRVKQLDKQEHFDLIVSDRAASIFQHILTMRNCHRAWVNLYIKERGRPFTINPTDWVVLSIEKHNCKRGNYKKIIAVSESLKQELMKYYGVPDEDIVVIHNGVNFEDFEPDPETRFEMRRQYDVKERDIILLWVGHYFGRKGLEYAIRALPMVHKDVKLFVVGGDNPSRYRQLAHELDVTHRVVFLGRSTNVKQWYAASDIFTFPTTYEAFGNVVLEAMATGIPVITSRIAGVAEVMRDGYDGLLLDDPTDAGEIAQKINLLYEDQRLRETIGSNARKTAEDYSWDKVAMRTLEVYKQVAQETGGFWAKAIRPAP